MELRRKIEIRMYLMLAMGFGNIVVAMYYLNNESDIMAMLSFGVSAIGFYGYWRIKKIFDLVNERTWRSSDP